MKIGYLERKQDVSGVTGVGRVADIAIHPDGRVAVFWPPPTPSVAVFPNLEALKGSHGHNGLTDIVILNDEVENLPHCGTCHAAEASPESRAKCQDHDFGCPSCLSQVG